MPSAAPGRQAGPSGGALVAVRRITVAIVASLSALGAQALLGVYDANQGWEMDQVRAMEARQGRRHAVVRMFADGCPRGKTMDNLFKQQLPAVWASGNMPLVSWEPFLCPASATPADIAMRVARGDHDGHVKAWAGRLKAFVAGPDGSLGTGDDRRVYRRLAHEMNGDWCTPGAARRRTT